MPKEKIDDISGSGFRAELTWNHDGHVQLATVDPSHRIKHEDVADPDHPNGEFSGWYVTLDRDRINQLIRSLRRARDYAFGADA